MMLILFAWIFLASCSGVTETGNPCPAGVCVPTVSPNLSAGTELYENEEFGISIIYPEEWSFEEIGEEADAKPGETGEEPQFAIEESFSIVFRSPADYATTAFISFERLYVIPPSLYAYLADKYPDRKFIHYSTMTLSGYLYDNPQAGENGGDLQEYFFLKDTVLIHIEAEVFDVDRIRFASLINGIMFK